MEVPTGHLMTSSAPPIVQKAWHMPPSGYCRSPSLPGFCGALGHKHKYFFVTRDLFSLKILLDIQQLRSIPLSLRNHFTLNFRIHL